MAVETAPKERRPPSPAPAVERLDRVQESGRERRACVRLDRNERLEPLPSWLMATIRESLESDLLTTYPTQDDLVERLAASVGMPAERLLLTAGSDAAVKALYQAYVRPGDAVMMLEPSYAMYAVYAQMFDAQITAIPFTEALVLDEERLIERVVPGIRLVMLANPNQPTGTLIGESTLRRLVDRARDAGALLAIDEAYYPFSGATVLPWVRDVPHLVVLRTFSKAAGLAGLRIGFVASHPDVIRNLFNVRSTYDVNSIAMLCAAQLLAHPQVVGDYVAQVEAGRRLLVARVRSLGLEPLPTHTNFQLIRVAHRLRPALLVERLRQEGYLVSGPFKAPSLADCIRVTLGPPALLERFADILGRVLEDPA